MACNFDQTQCDWWKSQGCAWQRTSGQRAGNTGPSKAQSGSYFLRYNSNCGSGE